MGCDIHVYLERKRTINGEKKWVNIDYFKKNPYYSANEDGERNLEHVPVYSGRNYGLFSILADVRNYGGVKCISQPKGVPDDISDATKFEYEYWQDDAHSESYFTLKELIDFYNSNKFQSFSGMINKQQQIELEKGITPDSWCQWTNVDGYEFKTWNDDSQLKNIIEPIKKRIVDEFSLYAKTDLELYLKIYGLSDDIRIVFWFDN